MKLANLLSPEEILESKVPADLEITGVTNNSSEAGPGTLFFAIAGTRVDGHTFATQVSSAAVVVERRDAFARASNAILVRSTKEALGHAAARWHGKPTRELKLVGVTGTNGKTTTTYLLNSVWKRLGFVTGILGTVEYHIGRHREKSGLTTPDALGLQRLFRRMVDENVTHAAMEVSSIALDQHRVTGSEFQVGIFTNLTQDHLDYHGDLDSYFEAKKRFFVDFPMPRAVFNVDDAWGARMRAASAATTNFSFSLLDPKADFYVEAASFDREGIRAKLRTPVGTQLIESPLIGKHNLYNCVGALAACHSLGLDLFEAAEAMGDTTGAPGRLERVTDGQQTPHVFVDYAHTEDALHNVLRSLRELRGQSGARIITVFGCGGDRDRSKRPRMAKVVSALSDVTVATSDNPRTENPDSILDEVETGIDSSSTEYHREVNRRRAIHLALDLARPGDLVLVAGKGHETYQILGREEFPFDDREVVREYYRDVVVGQAQPSA